MLSETSLLTYQDVAKCLRVSYRTVQRLVQRGELGCVIVCQRTPRVSPAQLAEYQARRTADAA